MSIPRAQALGGAIMAAFATVTLATFGLAQTPGIALNTEIDPSIRAGDDFYGYVNSRWIAATPRPESVSRVDTTSMLRAENARRVQSLIESVVPAPSTRLRQRNSTVDALVGNYYATQLDAAGIDARGLAPLSGDLAAIAAIADRRELAAYLGRSLRVDDGTNQHTESLWGVWVHQGFHDPNHYAAHLVQGGLGLPDASDYLDPAPDHAAHRALYLTHITAVLGAAGIDQPDIAAARVLELEVAIARTHASQADTSDVFKTDNTWRRADFVANAPGLDWNAFFAAAGLDNAASFVVWQPQAVVGGSRLVATQSIEAWKDYFAFHLIEHYAPALPAAVRDERRAFEARLSGAELAASDPRREAIAATEAVLGDAVGQLYVARYFSPQARTAANTMVDNIRAAFRARLDNVAWMSPATRALASAKLQTLRVGLGYPQRWIDYSGLSIVPGDAFGNLRRAEAFAYRREIAKLSRSVDPDEWAVQLHPQMVGAILNLSPNTMQFTAGLLQPPYFDWAGDAALNYGSAGAGIAHEISHSFDEVGNIYDAQGRLVRWWTPEDTARFAAATAPLAGQLSACCPAPDVCAHGAQVLSESAADLIGLIIAHDAYLLSLHGHADVIRNGLTGEQRLFIAFGQRWRRQQSDPLHQQIEHDSHAPPQCRAGLVRNVDAWARAFNVQRGDRLYVPPEARIHVW